ncbi:dentin sialophosphoprotein-like [Bombus flavifrons]|uniref:dentin sialophosphoprotein-like n=1 Tax=Bombus flavifrons TaxID=103934 RepID=UPI00370461BF
MHTNVRSIVVPGTESVSSTPPVPPRRKKRKAKLAVIAKSPKGTSPTRLRKPDKKRLAPPPPPPPPRAVRRIKSHVDKDQAEERTSNSQTVGDAEETLNSLSSNETGETSQPSSLQFEDADSVRIEKASKDENEKDDKCGSSSETKSPHKRPFVFETFTRKETNKYPPLFFTLNDFQNVMSNTLQREDDFNDEPSANFDSSFHDSFRNSLRNSFREFFEKSLDDEEDDLCFRVTTTNLPFEKCLDTWTATFADRLIENFDVPSRFIFEDYIDRSNKVNVRRSAGPMCYDSFEEEPTVPRLTKVRFVIESPSSSTSDHELNNDGETTCDSLQNIDPLTDEQEVSWNRGSSVKLTEVTDDMECTDMNKAFGQVQDFQEDHDEFGDVPFSSILRTGDSLDRWYSVDDATNFVRAIDKGSFGQDDRGISNDPIGASIGHDSHADSLCSEGKLKVADVSEAESSLIKLKAECRFVLAEVRDDCSERPPEDNDFARASNNYTAANNVGDNKKYHDEKDLTSEASENENINVKREEIISVGTNAIANNFDWNLELIRNEINVNFVQEDSIIRRDKYLRTEINEEQSTISETKVFDQQIIKDKVENNVLKKHLLSNRTETDISEEVSSAEEDMEIDKQQLQTDSVDKSTGEYRRKIFVNESLRNIINRCDFTSNDFADDSEDSDVQDDNLDTGDISLGESERNFKGLITKGDTRQETKDIPVSQSNKKLQDNFVGNESFEKRKGITNPVNIQRNSFLVNMLSEDTDQIWTSCEIIAVLPKSLAKSEVSISKDEEGKKLANRLNESIKMDSEIQKILQESKAPLERIETTLPKPTTVKKIVETSKKTTGEAKCDVLNELLCNFSNIKLKPVNDEKRSAAESHPRVKTSSRQENDKERIESMSDSRTQRLKDCNGNSSVETKETSDESMNLEAATSSVKQWQYAVSLTTRKVQDDRNKSNDSQKRSEGSQNNTANSTESVKPTESSEILADRKEESREIDVNRVGRTVKQWQYAASLTTSNYIPDDRNKDIESQERSEDFQDDISFVTNTVNRINRVERTTNENYSELSRNMNEVLVEPTKNDTVRRVSDDEAGRGGASSVECLQMVGCSAKTDESHNRGAYARQLELSKSMSSGDKSAIARRISRPHCNNNDNNRAVTPVAVSDDQSRDTVTITPGRVRSFIKYYEIQREATTDDDSKTNDRVDKDPMPEHQSVISICRGLEARAIEAKFFEAQKKDNSKSLDTMKKDDYRGLIADQDVERSIGSARKEGKCAAIVEKFETENSSRLNARIANTEDDYVEMMKQIHLSPKSIGDSCAHSGTVRRKKSVKFQGGFTVIGTKDPDENGTAGSPAAQDTKLLDKKKNLDRLTLEGSVLAEKVDFGVEQLGELLDADSRSLEKRQTDAEIQAAAKCEECSGILFDGVRISRQRGVVEGQVFSNPCKVLG